MQDDILTRANAKIVPLLHVAIAMKASDLHLAAGKPLAHY